MQKYPIIGIIIALVFTACSAPLTPFDQSVIEQHKDFIAPIMEVYEPSANSEFSQTVSVTGSVSDNGDIMPIVTYLISDSLNSLTIEGDATVSAVESETGSEGVYAFNFSSVGFTSDILISITAEDVNGNKSQPIKIPLAYPGNTLPSFSAVAGNNSISLRWEPINGAEKYRLFYTSGAELFLMAKASVMEINAANYDPAAPVVLNSVEHGINNGNLCQLYLQAEGSGKEWTSALIRCIPLSSYSLVPQTSSTDSVVNLCWNEVRKPENVDVVYEVWRSSTGENNSFRLLSDQLLTEPCFQDASVVSGQIYYYRIGTKYSDSILSEAIDTELTVVSSEISSTIETFIRNENVIAMDITGDYCYAVVFRTSTSPHEFDLISIDITDKFSPVELDRCTYSFTSEFSRVYDIELINSRAYIATSDKPGGSYGVFCYNIENPARLVEAPAGNILLSSLPKGLVADKTSNMLYIAEGKNISRLSVANPDSPGAVSSVMTAGSVLNGLCLSAGYIYAYSEWDLYAADTSTWISVSKILTPDFDGVFPEWLSSFGYPIIQSISADDKGRLFITAVDEQWETDPYNYLGGLFIYDMNTNPAIPNEIYKGNQGYPFSYAVADGNSLYMTSRVGMMRMLNIANTQLPREYQTVYTSGNSISAAQVDEGVYVADGAAGLALIQVSSPEEPVNVFDKAQSGINGSCLHREFFYQASESGLSVYNTDSDGTMTILSTKAVACEDVEVVGSTAFIASGANIGVIDVSSPLNIDTATVDYYECDSEVTSIVISGDFLYAVQGERGVKVFNISGGNLIEVALISIYDEAVKAEVVSDYLFVADSGSGLIAYDISDPYSPQKVGEFYVEGNRSVRYFTADSDYVYCVCAANAFILPVADAPHWRPADLSSASYTLGSAVSIIDDLTWSHSPLELKKGGDILYSVASMNINNGRIAMTSVRDPKNPNTYYASSNNFYSSGTFIRGIQSIELSGGRLWSNFDSWIFLTDLSKP